MKKQRLTRNTKWYSIILKDNWCFLPTFYILTVWFVWAVQLLTGINIFRTEDGSIEPGDFVAAKGTLELAIIGTAICLPLAIYRFARTRRVLLSGIEVPFRIVSHGFKKGAYCDIRIEYSVNKKLFTKRFSAFGKEAEGQFKLIVNPTRPKHIVILDVE